MKYLEINKDSNSSLFEIILNNQRKIWFDLLYCNDLTKLYNLTDKQKEIFKSLHNNLKSGLFIPVKEVVIFAYHLTVSDKNLKKERKQLRIFYDNLCDGIDYKEKVKFLISNLINQFMLMEKKEKFFTTLFDIENKNVYSFMWKSDRDLADVHFKKTYKVVQKAIVDCIKVKESSFKEESLSYNMNVDYYYDDFKKESKYCNEDGVCVTPLSFGFYPSSRTLAHLETLNNIELILPVSFNDAKKLIKKQKYKNANLLLIEEPDYDFKVVLGTMATNGSEAIYMLHEVLKNLLENEDGLKERTKKRKDTVDKASDKVDKTLDKIDKASDKVEKTVEEAGNKEKKSKEISSADLDAIINEAIAKKDSDDTKKEKEKAPKKEKVANKSK